MESMININPFEQEKPSVFADRIGELYTKKSPQKSKKEKGQFFTPLVIAQFMANLSEQNKKEISILDPGCGVLVLTCSVIEHLVGRSIERVNLTVYETDVNIVPYLEKVLAYLTLWLENQKIDFHCDIRLKDYILDNITGLTDISKNKTYDLIISNPPYFKLPKTDDRVVLFKSFLEKIPNIYALFIYVAGRQLKPEGEMIFITPRSFTAGDYFRPLRNFIFSTLELNYIHLFDSRRAIFKRDKVLQETLIFRAKLKKGNHYQIKLSSSQNSEELSDLNHKQYLIDDVVDQASDEKTIHIPTSPDEDDIIEQFKNWKFHLSDFGIRVSTGPVVSFRANDFISQKRQDNCVPLYWLHNIKPMAINWPSDFKSKGQYIINTPLSNKILLSNKNYVFVRRFSTKDDSRRLIAAPYFSDTNECEYIGVENKLNYIYKESGILSKEETLGLAAFFNSDLYNNYFSIFNGNVNVSATELRQMTFPSLNIIKNIGSLLINNKDVTLKLINNLITELR